MGENAYFIASPQRSPHASLENTCVTCHMELTPPPAEFSYQSGGTNHEFSASIEICSKCHSDALSGEAFTEGYAVKLNALGKKLSSYLLAKISNQVYVKDRTTHTFAGNSYSTTSDAFVLSKDNIVSINAIELRGLGFEIKLKNPITVTYSPTGETPHTQSLSTITVNLGDITTDGKTTNLIALTDPMVKAGWNYVLILLDKSNGIHNPSFVKEVLDASITALK